jgi:hypothetical protein
MVLPKAGAHRPRRAQAQSYPAPARGAPAAIPATATTAAIFPICEQPERGERRRERFAIDLHRAFR